MANIPHHESFFALTGKALHYFFKDFYTVIIGGLTSFIGYLLPIKDIVHLLVLFFIADVVFGYWAARNIRKERFSVKIIWEHTMPRMLVSIVLVTGTFMWDRVYEQDLVSTHKIIGWFVSGVLLFSIAQNGYKITKWSVFSKLGGMIGDKLKDDTGFDINDEAKF